MNGQASTATGYSPCLMAKFRSAMSLLAEAVSRLSVRMFSILDVVYAHGRGRLSGEGGGLICS